MTVTFRPFMSLPFKAWTAACASALLGISINPNPFDSPLNLSLITFAVATSPNAPNAFLRSSSVTSRDKLPT